MTCYHRTKSINANIHCCLSVVCHDKKRCSHDPKAIKLRWLSSHHQYIIAHCYHFWLKTPREQFVCDNTGFSLPFEDLLSLSAESFSGRCQQFGYWISISLRNTQNVRIPSIKLYLFSFNCNMIGCLYDDSFRLLGFTIDIWFGLLAYKINSQNVYGPLAVFSIACHLYLVLKKFI